MKSKIISFLFIAFISFLHSEAKVKLATVLSDGMVLQRDKPIKIWGTADAGERIIIEFRKKQYETTASLNGKWQTELIATKAGGPFEMKVNNKRYICWRRLAMLRTIQYGIDGSQSNGSLR